jgi:hypothetical protein
MAVTWLRRVAVGMLLATVAFAFADSSIVVLALPDLLGSSTSRSPTSPGS